VLAVPVSAIEKYLATLRKLLTIGVAVNNDPHFDDAKKHHPSLQLIVAMKQLLITTTMQVLAVATSCCANALSFCLSFFVFKRQAATK